MEKASFCASQHRQSAGTKGTVEEDDVYPIHLQDFNFRQLIMVCTLRFDHVLDAYKLHTALARLLEKSDWRKLGGRVRCRVSCHCPGTLLVQYHAYYRLVRRKIGNSRTAEVFHRENAGEILARRPDRYTCCGS